MKKAIKRSIVIILILILSVGIGFAYQSIWDRIDRFRYPRNYSEYVEKYSGEYGVPEHIVYAVIKVESNFQSNAVSSAGAIGLMQITPDTFDWIMMLLREDIDKGLLYDPETNIKYGTYLLSYLYNEFGHWNTVYSAYNAGMTRVRKWLENPDYSNGDGLLEYIPIEETRKYVPKINSAIEVYLRLYYENT